MSKKKTKDVTLTIAEYAALTGITKPSISYRMNNNGALPGIKSITYDTATRTYTLVRDSTISNEALPAYFRQKKA